MTLSSRPCWWLLEHLGTGQVPGRMGTLGLAGLRLHPQEAHRTAGRRELQAAKQDTSGATGP